MYLWMKKMYEIKIRMKEKQYMDQHSRVQN